MISNISHIILVAVLVLWLAAAWLWFFIVSTFSVLEDVRTYKAKKESKERFRILCGETSKIPGYFLIAALLSLVPALGIFYLK